MHHRRQQQQKLHMNHLGRDGEYLDFQAMCDASPLSQPTYSPASLMMMHPSPAATTMLPSPAAAVAFVDHQSTDNSQTHSNGSNFNSTKIDLGTNGAHVAATAASHGGVPHFASSTPISSFITAADYDDTTNSSSSTSVNDELEALICGLQDDSKGSIGSLAGHNYGYHHQQQPQQQSQQNYNASPWPFADVISYMQPKVEPPKAEPCQSQFYHCAGVTISQRRLSTMSNQSDPMHQSIDSNGRIQSTHSQQRRSHPYNQPQQQPSHPKPKPNPQPTQQPLVPVRLDPASIIDALSPRNATPQQQHHQEPNPNLKLQPTQQQLTVPVRLYPSSASLSPRNATPQPDEITGDIDGVMASLHGMEFAVANDGVAAAALNGELPTSDGGGADDLVKTLTGNGDTAATFAAATTETNSATVTDATGDDNMAVEVTPVSTLTSEVIPAAHLVCREFTFFGANGELLRGEAIALNESQVAEYFAAIEGAAATADLSGNGCSLNNSTTTMMRLTMEAAADAGIGAPVSTNVPDASAVAASSSLETSPNNSILLAEANYNHDDNDDDSRKLVSDDFADFFNVASHSSGVRCNIKDPSRADGSDGVGCKGVINSRMSPKNCHRGHRLEENNNDYNNDDDCSVVESCAVLAPLSASAGKHTTFTTAAIAGNNINTSNSNCPSRPSIVDIEFGRRGGVSGGCGSDRRSSSASSSSGSNSSSSTSSRSASRSPSSHSNAEKQPQSTTASNDEASGALVVIDPKRPKLSTSSLSQQQYHTRTIVEPSTSSSSSSRSDIRNINRSETHNYNTAAAPQSNYDNDDCHQHRNTPQPPVTLRRSARHATRIDSNSSLTTAALPTPQFASATAQQPSTTATVTDSTCTMPSSRLPQPFFAVDDPDDENQHPQIRSARDIIPYDEKQVPNLRHRTMRETLPVVSNGHMLPSQNPRELAAQMGPLGSGVLPSDQIQRTAETYYGPVRAVVSPGERVLGYPAVSIYNDRTSSGRIKSGPSIQHPAPIDQNGRANYPSSWELVPLAELNDDLNESLINDIPPPQQHYSEGGYGDDVGLINRVDTNAIDYDAEQPIASELKQLVRLSLTANARELFPWLFPLMNGCQVDAVQRQSQLGSDLRLAVSIFGRSMYVKDCVNNSKLLPGGYFLVYGAIPKFMRETIIYLMLTFCGRRRRDAPAPRIPSKKIQAAEAKSAPHRPLVASENDGTLTIPDGTMEMYAYAYWQAMASDLIEWNSRETRVAEYRLLQNCVSKLPEGRIRTRIHQLAKFGIPEQESNPQLSAELMLYIKAIYREIIAAAECSGTPSARNRLRNTWHHFMARCNVHHYLCPHTSAMVAGWIPAFGDHLVNLVGSYSLQHRTHDDLEIPMTVREICSMLWYLDPEKELLTSDCHGQEYDRFKSGFIHTYTVLCRIFASRLISTNALKHPVYPGQLAGALGFHWASVHIHGLQPPKRLIPDVRRVMVQTVSMATSASGSICVALLPPHDVRILPDETVIEMMAHIELILKRVLQIFAFTDEPALWCPQPDCGSCAARGRWRSMTYALKEFLLKPDFVSVKDGAASIDTWAFTDDAEIYNYAADKAERKKNKANDDNSDNSDGDSDTSEDEDEADEPCEAADEPMPDAPPIRQIAAAAAVAIVDVDMDDESDVESESDGGYRGSELNDDVANIDDDPADLAWQLPAEASEESDTEFDEAADPEDLNVIKITKELDKKFDAHDTAAKARPYYGLNTTASAAQQQLLSRQPSTVEYSNHKKYDAARKQPPATPPQQPPTPPLQYQVFAAAALSPRAHRRTTSTPRPQQINPPRSQPQTPSSPMQYPYSPSHQPRLSPLATVPQLKSQSVPQPQTQAAPPPSVERLVEHLHDSITVTPVSRPQPASPRYQQQQQQPRSQPQSPKQYTYPQQQQQPRSQPSSPNQYTYAQQPSSPQEQFIVIPPQKNPPMPHIHHSFTGTTSYLSPKPQNQVIQQPRSQPQMRHRQPRPWHTPEQPPAEMYEPTQPTPVVPPARSPLTTTMPIPAMATLSMNDHPLAPPPQSAPNVIVSPESPTPKPAAEEASAEKPLRYYIDWLGPWARSEVHFRRHSCRFCAASNSYMLFYTKFHNKQVACCKFCKDGLKKYADKLPVIIKRLEFWLQDNPGVGPKKMPAIAFDRRDKHNLKYIPDEVFDAGNFIWPEPRSRK